MGDIARNQHYTPSAYIVAAAQVEERLRGTALATVAFVLTASTVIGVPFSLIVGLQLGWHSALTGNIRRLRWYTYRVAGIWPETDGVC